MSEPGMSFYRSAVFVDGGYLDKVLLTDGRRNIDYAKMVASLTDLAGGQSSLLRTYYYSCAPYISREPSEEENRRNNKKKAFFEAIRKLGITVKLGYMEYGGRDADGGLLLQQKCVDVLMATDMLTLSLKEKITHAVLVTGDGDYIPAVETMKAEGIKIWLASGYGTNDRLLQIVDVQIPLETLIKGCERKKCS